MRRFVNITFNSGGKSFQHRDCSILDLDNYDQWKKREAGLICANYVDQTINGSVGLKQKVIDIDFAQCNYNDATNLCSN